MPDLTEVPKNFKPYRRIVESWSTNVPVGVKKTVYVVNGVSDTTPKDSKGVSWTQLGYEFDTKEQAEEFLASYPDPKKDEA